MNILIMFVLVLAVARRRLRRLRVRDGLARVRDGHGRARRHRGPELLLLGYRHLLELGRAAHGLRGRRRRWAHLMAS